MSTVGVIGYGADMPRNRIKAEEIDPPPTSESEQGELTWKLELASQQKQTLRFEFTVAAPRSSQLVGLP